MPSWTPITEHFSTLRLWGPKSLETRAHLFGHDYALLVDWADAAPTPKSLWWAPAEDPSALKFVPLTFDTLVPGEVFRSQATDFAEALPAIRFLCTDGELDAAWLGKVVWGGEFSFGGNPWALRFVDGDFDGRLGGGADLWLALPKGDLQRLTFPNPAVELARLDEDWPGPGHSLHFAHARRLTEGGTVTLEAVPKKRPFDVLGRHLERVQREFEKTLQVSRRKLISARGGDPDRPVTATPAPWTYVTSMAQVRAITAAAHRPLLIEVSSYSCSWCRLLHLVTLVDAKVDALRRNFVCVRYLADLDPAKGFEQLGVSGFPSTLALDSNLVPQGSIEGFVLPESYAGTLSEWLSAAK